MTNSLSSFSCWVRLAGWALIFVCSFGSSAQDQSRQYSTIPKFVSQSLLGVDSQELDPVTAMLKKPYALPAEEDVAGNWGMPLEGMQLSFRMEKYTYEVGEPINVLLLLRNLANESIGWNGFIGTENEFLFTITGQDGTVVEKRDVQRFFAPPSRGSTEIPPKAQAAYGVDLAIAYDLLTPGTYQVYVARKISRRNEPGHVELRSSSAILRLLPPKDPDWTNKISGELKNRMEIHPKFKNLAATLDAKYPKPEPKLKPGERLFAPKENATQPTEISSVPTTVAVVGSSAIAVETGEPGGNRPANQSWLILAAVVCGGLVAGVVWRAKRRET